MDGLCMARELVHGLAAHAHATRACLGCMVGAVVRGALREPMPPGVPQRPTEGVIMALGLLPCSRR